MNEIQYKIKELVEKAVVESLHSNRDKIRKFGRKTRNPEYIDASGFAADIFPQQFGSLSLALIPTKASYEEIMRCSDLDMYFDCDQNLECCGELMRYVTSAMEGKIFEGSGLTFKEMEHVIFLGTAKAIMSSVVVDALKSINVLASEPDSAGFTNFFNFYVFNRERGEPKANYCEIEILSKFTSGS